MSLCYNIGMAYSNSRDRQSGRNNFGRRDFHRPGADRQMHQAVCSECGKDCQVPFVPSGDKPVFCSACFEQKRGSISTKRFADGPRPAQNNDQFIALNTKLDKILELLTPRPVAEETKELAVKVEKKKKAAKKTVLPPKA